MSSGIQLCRKLHLPSFGHLLCGEKKEGEKRKKRVSSSFLGSSSCVRTNHFEPAKSYRRRRLTPALQLALSREKGEQFFSSTTIESKKGQARKTFPPTRIHVDEVGVVGEAMLRLHPRLFWGSERTPRPPQTVVGAAFLLNVPLREMSPPPHAHFKYDESGVLREETTRESTDESVCVCACVRVSAGRGPAGNRTVCELGDANQHQPARMYFGK